MDGSFPPPSQPFATFYPAGYAPIMPPYPEVYHPSMQQFQSPTAEDFGSVLDADETPPTATAPPSGSRPRQRRRPSHDTDYVKHRRTRSGCYTCRQRRVKCDEAQPICDRCRKGSRECVYPSPSSTSRADRNAARKRQYVHDRDSSPSSNESDDGGDGFGLPSIPDLEGSSEQQDADVDSTSQSVASPHRQSTPRSQNSRLSSAPPSGLAAFNSRAMANLPRDVRIYLRFYQEHMSCHHYVFKFDRGDFMKSTLVDIALNDETHALLYALVAFAAYHRMIMRDDQKLSPFLSYYNKSIMLLQQSLTTRNPSTTTLLAILQLASIEEFLGDWVNLVGHQRAAYQILTDLFTPETIMQDATCRQLINWYIRFDLYAGLMSGGETKLGREWIAACHAYYKQQALENPNDVGVKLDELFSICRMIGTDITTVLAAKGRQSITDHDFTVQITDLRGQLQDYQTLIEAAFTDVEYIKEFPNAPPPSPDDITDYQDPHFVCAGKHFALNFVLMDFWALDLMFRNQVNNALRLTPSHETLEIAFKKCKMFEAMEYCDQYMPGALVGCQSDLAFSSLFLPKDEKHTNWARRKFVVVESKGYIYPATLRARLSELWGVDVTNWWLPNGEGYPGTIRAIRDFIDYRARVPGDAMGEHVRNMTGVFRIFELEETANITP